MFSVFKVDLPEEAHRTLPAAASVYLQGHRFLLPGIRYSVFGTCTRTRGMPQGSLLGPISFIIHIDDLSLLCNIFKYVDDTTLSEIIASSSSVSNMQSLLNQFFDLGR